jgi:hypothetical protein
MAGSVTVTLQGSVAANGDGTLLTGFVAGNFQVPVSLSGDGLGRYLLQAHVSGQVSGNVPSATGGGSPAPVAPGPVTVTGAVYGTVTGSVYDPATGASVLLTGTVQGPFTGTAAWHPQSFGPFPVVGSFTGSVQGSVTESVYGATEASGTKSGASGS